MGLGPQSLFIQYLKLNNGNKPFDLCFESEVSAGEERFVRIKTQITINKTLENKVIVYQKSYSQPDKWLIELGVSWDQFQIQS